MLGTFFVTFSKPWNLPVDGSNGGGSLFQHLGFFFPVGLFSNFQRFFCCGDSLFIVSCVVKCSAFIYKFAPRTV